MRRSLTVDEMIADVHRRARGLDAAPLTEWAGRRRSGPDTPVDDFNSDFVSGSSASASDGSVPSLLERRPYSPSSSGTTSADVVRTEGVGVGGFGASYRSMEPDLVREALRPTRVGTPVLPPRDGGVPAPATAARPRAFRTVPPPRPIVGGSSWTAGNHEPGPGLQRIMHRLFVQTIGGLGGGGDDDGDGTLDLFGMFDDAFDVNPPVDVRRPDRLACPTCMRVHLPVEGSECFAIPMDEEEGQGREVADTEAAVFGGGVTQAANEDNGRDGGATARAPDGSGINDASNEQPLTPTSNNSGSRSGADQSNNNQTDYPQPRSNPLFPRLEMRLQGVIPVNTQNDDDEDSEDNEDNDGSDASGSGYRSMLPLSSDLSSVDTTAGSCDSFLPLLTREAVQENHNASLNASNLTVPRERLRRGDSENLPPPIAGPRRLGQSPGAYALVERMAAQALVRGPAARRPGGAQPDWREGTRGTFAGPDADLIVRLTSEAVQDYGASLEAATEGEEGASSDRSSMPSLESFRRPEERERAGWDDADNGMSAEQDDRNIDDALDEESDESSDDSSMPLLEGLDNDERTANEQAAPPFSIAVDNREESVTFREERFDDVNDEVQEEDSEASSRESSMPSLEGINGGGNAENDGLLHVELRNREGPLLGRVEMVEAERVLSEEALIAVYNGALQSNARAHVSNSADEGSSNDSSMPHLEEQVDGDDDEVQQQDSEVFSDDSSMPLLEDINDDWNTETDAPSHIRLGSRVGAVAGRAGMVEVEEVLSDEESAVHSSIPPLLLPAIDESTMTRTGSEIPLEAQRLARNALARLTRPPHAPPGIGQLPIEQRTEMAMRSRRAVAEARGFSNEAPNGVDIEDDAPSINSNASVGGTSSAASSSSLPPLIQRSELSQSSSSLSMPELIQPDPSSSGSESSSLMIRLIPPSTRLARARAGEEGESGMSRFQRLLLERQAGGGGPRAETSVRNSDPGGGSNRATTNPLTHLRDYGAIRVFATATCPICLEECNPIVALPCMFMENFLCLDYRCTCNT